MATSRAAQILFSKRAQSSIHWEEEEVSTPPPKSLKVPPPTGDCLEIPSQVLDTSPPSVLWEKGEGLKAEAFKVRPLGSIVWHQDEVLRTLLWTGLASPPKGDSLDLSP